jgi:hypothetical protein
VDLRSDLGGTASLAVLPLSVQRTPRSAGVSSALDVNPFEAFHGEAAGCWRYAGQSRAEREKKEPMRIRRLIIGSLITFGVLGGSAGVAAASVAATPAASAAVPLVYVHG